MEYGISHIWIVRPRNPIISLELKFDEFGSDYS